jgi:hypothetical protein
MGLVTEAFGGDPVEFLGAGGARGEIRKQKFEEASE